MQKTDAGRSRVAGSGFKVNQMEEGRKRVLGIMASILVSRHLKTTEDLHDSRPSPRTESLVGSAVQWAERIMRRIDGTFANFADDKKWPRHQVQARGEMRSIYSSLVEPFCGCCHIGSAEMFRSLVGSGAVILSARTGN